MICNPLPSLPPSSTIGEGFPPFGRMAKSKNHTGHNQIYKWHGCQPNMGPGGWLGLVDGLVGCVDPHF